LKIRGRWNRGGRLKLCRAFEQNNFSVNALGWPRGARKDVGRRLARRPAQA
jgi:hypothetical protein